MSIESVINKLRLIGKTIICNNSFGVCYSDESGKTLVRCVNNKTIKTDMRSGYCEMSKYFILFYDYSNGYREIYLDGFENSLIGDSTDKCTILNIGTYFDTDLDIYVYDLVYANYNEGKCCRIFNTNGDELRVEIDTTENPYPYILLSNEADDMHYLFGVHHIGGTMNLIKFDTRFEDISMLINDLDFSIKYSVHHYKGDK